MGFFYKSNDLKTMIGIGNMAIELQKWFQEQVKSSSESRIDKDENQKLFTVTINGDMTIQNRDFLSAFEEKWKYKVILNVSGKLLVLDELSQEEIYQRIKKFYNKVLDNCLGKSVKEQEIYLYGSQVSFGVLKPGVIEASEEYIRGLPDTHEKADLNDLCEQIRSGKLEYGYHVADEYSVKMKVYMEILKKLIK